MNKESDKNNETNVENLENIKQLEIIIENTKKDIQAKDKDIMAKIKEIDILKREVANCIKAIRIIPVQKLVMKYIILYMSQSISIFFCS